MPTRLMLRTIDCGGGAPFRSKYWVQGWIVTIWPPESSTVMFLKWMFS